MHLLNGCVVRVLSTVVPADTCQRLCKFSVDIELMEVKAST